MQPPGQPDMNVTITAWADIVLKIWRDKIVQFKLYRSGDLYNSLKYEIERNSNGDPQKIEFAYKYYGMFADMGANSMTQRQWKDKPFYGQVMKLKEILTEKYIEQVKNGVIVSMSPD